MNNSSIETIFQEYFADGLVAFLPHISINCVVIGYRHPHLQVLVQKLPGQDYWMIPGGYVKKTESLDEAAYRNLKLAGIDEVFLRQIRTFGDVFRVTGLSESDFRYSEKDNEILEWIKQRFVTVVYYGLIKISTTEVVQGGLLNHFRWMDVDNLDKMAMDHAKIVSETRRILTTELLHQPVIMNLMPETFTLNELRGLFEAILNREIDRGTFRRKILKLGIVEQVDKRKDALGRPSHLYCLNQDAYNHFLAEETRFGF